MSIKHVPIIAKLFCFVISIEMDFIISRKKKKSIQAEATPLNLIVGFM